MAKPDPQIQEIEMDRYPPNRPLNGLEIDTVMPFKNSYGTADSLQVRATNKADESVWFKISMQDIERVLKSCDYRIEFGRTKSPKLVEPSQVRDIYYEQEEEE
jgi:hypothetical protein